MKKHIALIFFAVLLGISGVLLIKYINFSKNYATSNAVFVKTNSLTNLSFKIPGKIEKIYVNEGDFVKRGEILAKLDTKDLEIQKKVIINQIEALNRKIEANLIQKDKLVKDIDENIDLINVQIKKFDKLIEAKKYEIKAKESKLQKFQNDYKRFSKLYKNKKISIEKFENVKTAYFALKNEIKADKKNLESMCEDKNALFIKLKLVENNKKDIKKLLKIIDSMKAQLKALEERLALINQHIKDSFIYSPFKGKVAKKFANENEVINAGSKILSIVNPRDLYVLVLLEETKLKGVKKGNFTKIHIDALDKDYDGYVDKVLPASAATFAIVPRDISSGEFTKLTQRFYVRIKFKKVPKDVLIGMSGEVEIERR